MIIRIAAWIPYIAVLIGMYLFHSAWLAVLLYHAGIVAVLLYRKPTGLWRKIGSGYKARLLIPGMAICALAAPVVYFMWPWFAASEHILPSWLTAYGLDGWTWLLFIPYFSIVHPVLEEVHWRAISPTGFPIICREDLLFSGYHVLVLFQLVKAPGLVLVFAVLAGSSIFWRWTAQRLGGYALPILTHAVADAGVVIAVYCLQRHFC
jgi:membrane protease YdiL (CAAX protease family)